MERVRQILLLAVLVLGLFEPTARLIARPSADEPSSLTPTAAKAKKGLEDPVTYLLLAIAGFALKRSSAGYSEAWTKWKEILEKAKKETERLRAEHRDIREAKARYENLVKLFNTEVKPTVESIVEYYHQTKYLRTMRTEKMRDLEKKLGDGITFNTVEELDVWLRKTKEGENARQQYATWYREYRSIRSREKKLVEQIREEFNKLVVHGNDIMPHDDYARIEVQVNGSRRMMYYNGLTPVTVTPAELPGMASKMKLECEVSLEQVSGKLKERRAEFHKQADQVHELAASGGPRYLWQLAAPTGWGAVHLATSVPGLLKAFDYWGNANPPAPPPPIEKELVTNAGKKAFEPFTLEVKKLLKKHRPSIQKNIEENLTLDERDAIEISDLTLEDRVSILDFATDYDAFEMRTAMNKALKAYADQKVEEGDKFASILKLLNFKDFEQLSPKEQTSKLRAVHDFLSSFYATTFDVALKGVSKGATSRRVSASASEPLITETIESLKTMEWKVIRRPSDPPAVPVAPPAAGDAKTSNTSKVDEVKDSGSIKPVSGEPANLIKEAVTQTAEPVPSLSPIREELPLTLSSPTKGANN